MSIALALPDEKLAGLVESYGFFAMELRDQMTVGAGLVAFNISDTQIEVDGVRRDASALFGVNTDPVFVRYSLGSDPVLTMRVAPGAYDRMLGIDMQREAGVVDVDPKRHPILAGIDRTLRAAPKDAVSQFRALDTALLDCLPAAAPAGLAERFWHYALAREGDVIIAEAADDLGCTTRSLERACAKRLGRTPKRIARGIRVARTHWRAAETSERPELSADFAYADLPHYLNEMRRITGMNRREFSRSYEAELALPYRYFWPDGREATGDEEKTSWLAERERRWKLGST
ncbi:AraC family transcriptional regulator [Erythrobacter sp.]|jgi:AraC-like DNA-binding protein|uniref:AraC family transcriptional regulator n=1 Tax=Erythrobacter sp. TaxID=1042 RepID=UPI002EA04252|nr:helix-turn-helix domain-containing protein [Erythrobacter sp.]